jgi:hypothetical protein
MLPASCIKSLGMCASFAVLSLSLVQGQSRGRFDFPRIEDNSFLIEEAYNQDPGVIQHISGFQLMNNNTWAYTFTDEWPAAGLKHQVSATIPLMRTDASGLGDILVNYRYQAVYKERIAFSPRFSLIIPSGNYRKGLGEGVLGYQVSLPVSWLLSTKFVTHYNLGLTFTPGAKSPDGTRSNQTILNYGFSIIQFLSANFNFMLETVGSTSFVKHDGTAPMISNSIIINPGFRFAINFKSGLQIVPGLSVPVGFDAMNGEAGIFAYLSFEHPLWKPRNPE